MTVANTALDLGIDDEDADLATADRGNSLEGVDTDADAKAAADAAAAVDAEKVAADLARDAKGKFVKKEAEPDEEVVAAAAEAARVAEEEENQNFPVRLNKAKQQRDANAAAAAAAVARAEAAEAALRALTPSQAKAAPDPIADINAQLDELYTKVEEARADGDSKLAASLQRQIDTKNRDITRFEAENIAARTTTAASANDRFNTMLDVLESAIPQVDPRHEDYDADAVKELDFQVRAYEKMGLAAPDALRRASNLLFRVDVFAPKKAVELAKEAAVVAPAVPAVKKTDVAKAVATQNKQPPDASNVGANKDDTTINPETISDEDFDALPESKKRQMRGDFN